MRLTFVTTSLELGGAERTLALLASAWAKRGRQVTVIVFDQTSAPSYSLDSAVSLRSLGIPNGRARHIAQAISRNSQRIRSLRRAIRESRPDVVISFLDYTNTMTLLATRGLGLPVVVSEQANPDHVPMGRLWEALRRFTYPFAQMLVCPTSRMAELLEKRFRVRGRSIPNLVEVPAPVAPAKAVVQTKKSHRVAAMGRLVPQKGFDLLLHAFAQVADTHPEWSLAIIGKGPLRDELEAQARSLGIISRVQFSGELTDPFPVLRAADLFVFSSRFEGFGNALVEAMACGLPAISFDCAAGPSDIIRNEIDGILVPPEDVRALAGAMDHLMGNSEERERLASRAPDVLARFSLERILKLWDELFEEIAPSQSRNIASQPKHEAAPNS